MAMKELLRVTMNAKQVREACERWATDRANFPAGGTWSVAVEAGIANDASVEVVFRKARESTKKPTKGE